MHKIAADHRKSVRTSCQHQGAAYSKNPKRFHEEMCCSTGDDPPPKMTALHHPGHGVVTDPDLMLESMEMHHRGLMSPKVPPSLATNPPWEGGHGHAGASDPFTLRPRGAATQLGDRLTEA